jgi:hypothetical protein
MFTPRFSATIIAALALTLGYRLPAHAVARRRPRRHGAHPRRQLPDARLLAALLLAMGGTTGRAEGLAILSFDGYGLYDMAGNVMEWCYDLHINDYGWFRALRGGNWGGDAIECRVACYVDIRPPLRPGTIGFRTVLPSGQLPSPLEKPPWGRNP